MTTARFLLCCGVLAVGLDGVVSSALACVWQDETGAIRLVVPAVQAIAVGEIVMLSAFTVRQRTRILRSTPHPTCFIHSPARIRRRSHLPNAQMAIPFAAPPRGGALQAYIQAPATSGHVNSDLGLRRLVHSSLSLSFPRERVEGEHTILVDAVMLPAKPGGEGCVRNERGFVGGEGRPSEQRTPAGQTRVHGWMLTEDETLVAEPSSQRCSGPGSVLLDGSGRVEVGRGRVGPSGPSLIASDSGEMRERSCEDAARSKRQRVGSRSNTWTKVDVVFSGPASRHAAVMVPGGLFRMRGLDLVGASAQNFTVFTATETSSVGSVSLAAHAQRNASLRSNADEAEGNVADRGEMLEMREELKAARKEIGVDELVALPPEKLADQVHCVRAVIAHRRERAGSGEKDWQHGGHRLNRKDDNSDQTTLCLRCIDVATLDAQRRSGNALRGRVDVYLDRTKWFVPLGLLPGATVLFANLQARIGAHGGVYCLVGATTSISVETPAGPGWKEPQIATAAYRKHAYDMCCARAVASVDRRVMCGVQRGRSEIRRSKCI